MNLSDIAARELTLRGEIKQAEGDVTERQRERQFAHASMETAQRAEAKAIERRDVLYAERAMLARKAAELIENGGVLPQPAPADEPMASVA